MDAWEEDDAAFLREQAESRRRSGSRWARFSFYLGAFAVLCPFLAAGVREAVVNTVALAIGGFFYYVMLFLRIAMLPLGIAAVAAAYWSGLRAPRGVDAGAPKGLRSRRMNVERILGAILGIAAALFAVGSLAARFLH